jgi:hypothetical protein
VTRVESVDFGVFRPPVALGDKVTATLAMNISGRIYVRPTDSPGRLTLDASLRFLVTFDDGTIARASRDNVDLMLRQCGQEPLT